MKAVIRSGLLALALGLAAAPALAEDPPSKQSLKDGSCGQAADAEPATKPAPASNDGTAPGNTGSTGWSGGLGGSMVGTTPNGATAKSKSYQPAVARGLDPIATPIRAASAC